MIYAAFIRGVTMLYLLTRCNLICANTKVVMEDLEKSTVSMSHLSSKMAVSFLFRKYVHENKGSTYLQLALPVVHNHNYEL